MAKNTLNVRIDDDMRTALERWAEEQPVEMTLGSVVRFAIKRFLVEQERISRDRQPMKERYK